MPGKKDPGPSIKKKKLYEDLKEQGHDKESAARISNASAQGHSRRVKMSKKAAKTRKREGK